MGLMGRWAGCLRTTSLTGNMRDQEVLRIVAYEVLSEDQAPICSVYARSVIALQLSQLCLPDNHTARQGRPLGLH